MFNYRLDDWIEWIVVGVIVLLVVVVFSLPSLFSYYRCSTQAQFMGKQSDWGLMTGCMIKHKGEWIPLEKYRVVD